VGSRGWTQDGSGETAQEWLYTSSFGNAGESPGRPAAETQFEKPHGLNYGNTPKHDPLRTRAYLRKYASVAEEEIQGEIEGHYARGSSNFPA